jgi:hypothetical protein
MANVRFDTAYGFKPNIGSYAGTDTRIDRTMAVRLNDTINVKDWGAVGDGDADDTDKIQDAIDYAYVRGRGGIVFFPAGTYKIGTPPLRASPPRVTGGLMGVQLVGAGRDISILKGTYSTGQNPDVNPGFLVKNTYVGQDIIAARCIRSLTIWNESTTRYPARSIIKQPAAKRAL